jgi:PAS domain S-box-containing protein
MFSAEYDLALVALSVLVAILASRTALTLVQRILSAFSALSVSPASTVSSQSGRLLASAGCVLGVGIWTMHYIEMLAFQVPLQAGYDFRMVFLSLLLAILSSWLAFHVAGTGGRSLWRIGAGALSMGTGITAMHYIGMASLRLSPAIVYSPQLVVASAAIAVSASAAAFWLAFHLSGDARQRRLLLALATGAMSMAIIGTHFVGMAAAAFPLESVSLAYQDGMGQDALVINIIVATFCLLAAAIVTAMVDRARESDARSLSALQASHQQRDHLLDHLPGAVCRFRNDRAWTMEYASEGIRELTGHGSEAFCGKAGISYASLVHEDDRNRIYNEMQEAIYRREPFRLVYRLLAARERLKWVSAKGEGLYADDGSLIALQAFIVDITEHKEQEDKGRSALAAVTATLESTMEGIVVIDLDLTIAAMNQRCADMLRLPGAASASLDYESLTTHMLSIVADEPAYLKSRDRLLNYPDREFHDRILLKDGRLLARHSRPRLVDGSITGRVICLLDITEQGALEQGLVQARESAEFVSQRLARITEAMHRSRSAVVLPVEQEVSGVLMARAEDTAACTAAGMNTLLDKPLVPEVLYGTLSRCLSPVSTGDRAGEQPLPAQEAVAIAAPRAAGMPVHEVDGRPVINLDVLCDMVQADPEKLRHFAYRFMASAQDNVFDIQLAVVQENWPAIAGLGHRCKSSARAVGAFQFADLCEALEKMPVAVAGREAPAVVERLQPMLDAIRHEVGEWFQASYER